MDSSEIRELDREARSVEWESVLEFVFVSVSASFVFMTDMASLS